jgi:glyoxylase-like metal-dependent hydrolase (beta-lactamase superfamily II)
MGQRPPKQEQEAAGDAVTEVAPGVLRAQLPIDMPGLGHVNCYVLEDERGAAIVDPGLAGSVSRRALKSRLSAAGIPLRRVHTVIVTHSHPDHFGAAGWVRHETGAEIVTHRRFRLMWDPWEPPDVDVEDAVDRFVVNGDGDGVDDRVVVDVDAMRADLAVRSQPRMPWDPAPWGGSGMTIPFRRRARLRLSVRFPRLLRLPVPSVRLDDAGTIRLAGREWVALHTPGHTEDHLCLFDPTDGVMLSGDHVLPTITPHIGGFGPYRDPLACFFASLDKVAVHGPDTSICLPAHGHPFTNLTVRVDAIKRHHRERLDTLRSAFEGIGRPASVNELSGHLFSARAQGAMADSETFAHLEHLRVAGEVARTDAPTGYTYVPTA